MFSRDASAPAAISTGISRAVCTSCRSGEIVARLSTTIRVATRGPGGRAVSSGSSCTTVPWPTTIPSTRPRSWWTISREAAPEIQRLSPVRVAILPSSDMAHLAITHGRLVATSFKYGAFNCRAWSASKPISTAMPADSRAAIPRPLTSANGSRWRKSPGECRRQSAPRYTAAFCRDGSTVPT